MTPSPLPNVLAADDHLVVVDEIKTASDNQVSVLRLHCAVKAIPPLSTFPSVQGGSSTLEPDRELLERFDADNFSEMKEVAKRVPVPTISMADFMAKAKINNIDFMKFDTQGNEFNILKLAGDAIESINVIMTEVEFIPLNKDQALFYDVSPYLQTKCLSR